MSEDVKIPASLQKKLDTLGIAAIELYQQTNVLQEQFQSALSELEHVFREATSEDENEGYTARELFQDSPFYDEMYDLASNLGGKIGGDGGEAFEFWIPSNC